MQPRLMSTQELLNAVAYPRPGDNARRKFTPVYDVINIASGTTDYYPFTSKGTIFQNNQTFPLAGDQIFSITDINLYLQTAITTTALYAGLLALLQQSYLEIVVNARTMLKVPLIEVLSYNVIPTVGDTTGNASNLQTKYIYRPKRLILPIVLNSQADVEVRVSMPSATSTVFDGESMNITFNGVMLNKLDTLAVSLVRGNNYSQLAWTLWETLSVSTVNANVFNFFANRNTAPNLFSGTLPLSNTERLEVQAIEMFIGGNAGSTDVINLVRNNRINNNLNISVESVDYLDSNLDQMLSLAGAQASVFDDNAGTAVTTDLAMIDVEYKNKVLEIPLIIPANGNVQVKLQQPGSSLNSDQYFTLMLKGKKVREVQ